MQRQLESAALKLIGAARAWQDWQGAKFARFGDNMRQVAVTEGDKVEAEIRFGYSVSAYGLGDLAKVVEEISEAQVNSLVDEYESSYILSERVRKGGDKREQLVDAARIELGREAYRYAEAFIAAKDLYIRELPANTNDPGF